MSEDFDWGELDANWWLTTAKTNGATERHAKFAAAKHRGATNTDAARQAGFGSGGEASVRSEGYRLFRSNRVNQLLAMAVAETGTGYDGTVTKQESKQILSTLARGSDPAIKIKALESLSKIEDREQAANVGPEETIEDQFYLLINTLPETGLGAALSLGTFFNATGNIINFKFLAECAPIVSKNFPTEWARWRTKNTGPGHEWCADFLDRVAAGPLLVGDDLVAAVKAKVPSNVRAPKPISETVDATA